MLNKLKETLQKERMIMEGVDSLIESAVQITLDESDFICESQSDEIFDESYKEVELEETESIMPLDKEVIRERTFQL